MSVPADAVRIANLPVEGGRKLWTCVICGTQDFWGDSWSTFTSLDQEEAGLAVPTCSRRCRDEHRERSGRHLPLVGEDGRVISERPRYRETGRGGAS